MSGLKICLWITAILCLAAVFGVILPISCWQSFIDFFELGPLPDSPIIGYLIRLMSACFVGIGVFFAILATNPAKYPILVPFSGCAAVALGVVCGITGFAEKLPNLWFLGDALTALVLGALILIFWKKAKQPPLPSNETAQSHQD
ncbi:MAG: hypothetical protein ACYTFM_05295 [Planctomycetota bacterium]|jgi:hypothetical protein